MNIARWGWLGLTTAASSFAVANGDTKEAVIIAAAGPVVLGLASLWFWAGRKLKG